jgi:hypothetical protein
VLKGKGTSWPSGAGSRWARQPTISASALAEPASFLRGALSLTTGSDGPSVLIFELWRHNSSRSSKVGLESNGKVGDAYRREKTDALGPRGRRARASQVPNKKKIEMVRPAGSTRLPGCCPRAPARPAFSPGRTKVTGRKGKDERHVSFVRLERRLLFHSPEWRQLSARAKIFYLYLKAKYNTTNNGALQLHFSELHDLPELRSRKSFYGAARELQIAGWIERTKPGGLFRNPNLYRLTFRHDKLA